MRQILDEFTQMSVEQARNHFELKDTKAWTISAAQQDVIKNNDDANIVPISYRPFDTRYTFFTGNSKGFHAAPRGEFMNHIKGKDNILLIANRQVEKGEFAHCFVYQNICDGHSLSSKETNRAFPLYIYPENGQSSFDDGFRRRPNINPAQLQTLCNQTGLAYRPDAETEAQGSLKTDTADPNAATAGSFTPETLLDYIYAALHSPAYRRRYAEFLKTGFPRIPNPENRSQFLRLAAIGSELRQWHTLQHPQADIACFITAFDSPEPDMQVDKPRYAPDPENPETGSVYWNKTTGIRNVPAAAWQFYIGGYQPAQKWLKDRKGKTLTAADIEHYQKIILALTRTAELMQQIDEAA